MKRSVLIAFVLLACGPILSQGFTYVTGNLDVPVYNPSPFFGAGISLYDFDGDGWDDLSFPLEDDSLRIYKNNFGTFEQLPSPYFCPGDAKQITWADFDNDGDADFLLTVYMGTTKLFRNDGDLTFTDVSEDSGIPQQEGGRAFGASWYDYDKDGHLDVYICNYNILTSLGSNWLLHNNGDGTFEDVAEDLGVDNGLQLSFQSVWMDYNNDGWGDLLVVNDKENMPNALFENNQDGSFTDVSEVSGADILIDAMTATVGDFDKNGFQDIYCSNEAEGNVLLSNNGDGTFTDLAAEAGVLCNSLTWGSLFIDIDHDRDEDLYVAGTGAGVFNENFFFENLGDSLFGTYFYPGTSDLAMSSYGVNKADWNQDGFWDFGVSNAGSQPAALFENNGGSNHWLKVSLTGVLSHAEAIGTWLHCYSDGIKESIWTMSGENYLGQDAQAEIFSLGSATLVDSLQVLWPSGMEEWLYDLPADQSLQLTEGFSLSTSIFTSSTQSEFCEGQGFGAEVLGEGEVVWMDGVTGAYRVITETGSYYATLITPEGFAVPSDTLEVLFYPVNTVELISPGIACYGDSTFIQLETDGASPVASVVWNDGQYQGFLLDSIPAGSYSYVLQDVNGCGQQGVLDIEEPPAIVFGVSITDVLCAGDSTGVITVDANGGSGTLMTDWGCPDASCAAGEYTVTVIDENGCSADSTVVIQEPEPILITLTADGTLEADGSCEAEVSGGTPPYEFLWSNGEAGESIDGLIPDTYSLWIVDANGCLSYAEVVVEQLVGLTSYAAETHLPHPVPFDTFLYPGTVSGGEACIYSPSGRRLVCAHLESNQALDTGSLLPGTYVLRWTEQSGRVRFSTVVK